MKDPEWYGVVGFDQARDVNTVIEKPMNPDSNYAVTGLFFLDTRAPFSAKKVKQSSRGELKIMSLLESYLVNNNLTVEKMGRGYAWLVTGTHASILDAGNFAKTLTE